jgi:hypothetical protein
MGLRKAVNSNPGNLKDSIIQVQTVATENINKGMANFVDLRQPVLLPRSHCGRS